MKITDLVSKGLNVPIVLQMLVTSCVQLQHCARWELGCLRAMYRCKHMTRRITQCAFNGFLPIFLGQKVSKTTGKENV